MLSPQSSRNTTIAISWLQKQRIPKGSTPLCKFDSADYLSSSDDEEYEGFLNKGYLYLYAPESTTTKTITNYLRPYKAQLHLGEQKNFKGKIMKTPISFKSHEDAMAVLERYKSRKMNKHSISLGLSVNQSYKSFCITEFPKTLTANEIPNYLSNSFKRFEGVEDTAYLYICLEGFTTIEVEKEIARIGSPKCRSCNIKPSVTKAEFAKLAKLDKH